MQDLIADVIRGVGWGTLRLLSLGRYRGGAESDRVAEGSVGLDVVLAIMYVGYAVSA